MAEPILGQALALQSEFRPDTTPLLTRAADKLGDINLKKTIAKQKAEEAKQKELQNLYSAIKLDTPKISQHFIPEARDLYAKSLMGMMEAANKGDRFEVERLKGEANMRLNILAMNSQAADKFLESEKQGFIVPQEVKVAFAMPKQQGQEYLKDLFNKKPELRGLVDINEYGDYTFNNIKNLNVEDDLVETISKNERLLAPTGKKVVNYRTKDEEEIYRIPDDKIQEFSIIKSQDPELRANILLKDREKLEEYTQKAQAAKPSMTAEEAADVGLQNYLFDKLQKVNEKRIKSNIPQKGGLDISLGTGFKTANKWVLQPEQTIHTVEDKETKKRNEQQLQALNEQRAKVNPNLPPLTYEQAYPKAQPKNYDEVVLENQDVSENKTFQYPDGKGGLIEILPVSIRRSKGSNEWKLVGKQKRKGQGYDAKEELINVEIPYSKAVRQKTDAILGTDTDKYLRETFGNTSKSQSNTVTSQPRKQEVKKFNTSIKFN